MIAALARPSLARLARLPRSRLAIGVWCFVGLAFAGGARLRGSLHGADEALLNAYGALALPLMAYAVVGAAVGSPSLAASIAPLVVFGASRVRAAAATVAASIGACALLGALLATAVAMVAHGAADPALGRDAIDSAKIGALGGVAYGAWFAVGSSLGGAGRAALLIADWVLGSLGGPLEACTPRAHVRNLLGGLAPAACSQRCSSGALVAIAVACVVIVLIRARAPGEPGRWRWRSARKEQPAPRA